MLFPYLFDNKIYAKRAAKQSKATLMCDKNNLYLTKVKIEEDKNCRITYIDLEYYYVVFRVVCFDQWHLVSDLLLMVYGVIVMLFCFNENISTRYKG